MKQLSQLTRLSRIDCLIRDPTFIATQPAIARALDVSDRTIRSDFDILTALGAPLVLEGRWSNGWNYDGEWDLFKAVKDYCTSEK